MRAVIADGAGGPEILSVGEVPTPEPGAGEVLVRVAAAGLNRADLLQRQGFYPPPPGASETIGMECSGTIEELGDGAEGWSVGDQVTCLLAGGGYAESVAVPIGQVMPVPDGVDLVTAAALPEVAATVWSNLIMVAGMSEGDSLLVHGGAGGIGSFAIQFATARGIRVLTTGGTPAKLEFCRELGADAAIDYHEQDFVEEVKALTEGRGVDVVLDNMGAKYLARNISVLADGGRLVVIGMQGGAKAELDIASLLQKRRSVTATALRSRPVAGKSEICRGVVEDVWPLVGRGRIRPIVETVMPLDDVRAAHELMEAGSHTGKILLTP
ncbi:NAD(P)H-quinone oxidoreductase [Nocardioides acrostichi]|uniref:NAD(P)H-quinone oxidoreductase n=1 Tax=Nocardioides acrostichi TaxID=2784339 RepID=A0A930V4A4_9ACTN|nr:NAD(P)H-quinone oxidoreductase [Nocardioides acrostichi]MBF4163739.1 NAD(P)H-quinone oxidoreductase [Nocardioides acrostichi]